MTTKKTFCKEKKNQISIWCSSMTLYWIFASLRIILTIIQQNGYIHPDEFFQSIEVASGESFDIDVNKPWEFNATFPIRSYLFPYVTVTLPYFILKILDSFCHAYLGVSLKTPYFLVLFPRLFMTILSFISDLCLYKICKIFRQPYKERLVIFASSYVMLIYASRTFSNSIEMIFMSLLLYYVSQCIDFSSKVVIQSDYLATKYYKSKPGVERAKYYKLLMSLPSHSLNHCLILATITVFGIFNRLTFIFYAFPPIFFWLQRGLGSKTVGFLDFHLRIFTFIICGIPTLVGLVLYDSLYFGYLTVGEIGKFKIGINNFVITPFNFFKYNVNINNLEKHGLHSQYQHFLINVPLLFNILGVIGVFMLLKMIYSGINKRWLELPSLQDVESLMTVSFVAPIILLSVFPHQEPRFIIPVIMPLVFLYAHKIKQPPGAVTIKLDNGKKQCNLNIRKKSVFKNISYLWYFCNFIMVLFYGFIHQGGVLSLTTNLAKELKAKPYFMELHVFTSYSYPIPTGLLHLRNTQKIYKNDKNFKYKLIKDFYLYELNSEKIDTIKHKINTKIKECENNLNLKNTTYRIYYALPSSLLYEFFESIEENEFKFKIVKSFYPHISIEKLPLIYNFSECINTDKLYYCLEELWDSLKDNYMKFLHQFSLVLLKIEKN